MKRMLFAFGFAIFALLALVVVSPVNATSHESASVPAISCGTTEIRSVTVNEIDTVVSFDEPIESRLVPAILYYDDASGGGNYTRDWVLTSTDSNSVASPRLSAPIGGPNTSHAASAKGGVGDFSRTRPEQTADHGLWPAQVCQI